MIHEVSMSIANFLFEKKYIEEDDVLVSAYGTEIVIATFLDFFAILFLGLINCRVDYSAIFLSVTTLVRSYTGGYHAKSHFRCICTSAAMFVLAITITVALSKYSLILTVLPLGVFNMAVIFLYAPVTNENRFNSEEKNKKSRKTALLLTSLTISLSLILSIWGFKQSIMIAVSLWIVSINIIIENLRRHYHEKDRGKNIEDSEQTYN